MSDLISRQAAIDALAKHEKSKGHNYTLFVDIVSECAEIIRDLPSAERRGRWNIELDKNRLFYDCKCSVCGHIESFDPKFRFFNYCPNCGASMRGEEE